MILSRETPLSDLHFGKMFLMVAQRGEEGTRAQEKGRKISPQQYLGDRNGEAGGAQTVSR